MAEITVHAEQRIEERLVRAFGLDKAEVMKRLRRINEANCQAWVAVTPKKVWVGESNGDGLAAIVRDGRVTTVCLRRTTQSPLMSNVIWAREII